MTPRFYRAKQDDPDDDNDGIYMFRPQDNSSLPYSELASVEMKEGQFTSMFHLTYLAREKNQGNLTVTVELNQLDEAIRFDVDILEITVDPKLSKKNLDTRGYQADLTTLPEEFGGKDVMIDWQFIDFNTNGDLWYDANGLQMVHKQLWKRQEYEQHIQNASIASNFYPI
jgi:hypothetical protein